MFHRNCRLTRGDTRHIVVFVAVAVVVVVVVVVVAVVVGGVAVVVDGLLLLLSLLLLLLLQCCCWCCIVVVVVAIVLVASVALIVIVMCVALDVVVALASTHHDARHCPYRRQRQDALRCMHQATLSSHLDIPRSLGLGSSPSPLSSHFLLLELLRLRNDFAEVVELSEKQPPVPSHGVQGSSRGPWGGGGKNL